MIKTMDDLMSHMIQELYSAEKQALAAMPILAQLVHSNSLQQALQVHQRETHVQLIRLEQMAHQVGIDPEGKPCVSMQKLIEQTHDLLARLSPGPLADAAIIGAAQKMEHVEMASYGTARILALQTGLRPLANLLETTLKEEKAANTKLTAIATQLVNPKAVRA